MILSGNGREFTVPGKNLKLKIVQPFDRKELSGDGSGTDFATAGNKPKTISAGLVIQDDKEEDLRNLFAVAEATTTTGDPVVYTVSDRFCQALNIRQVIFVDSINADEADGLRAWNVSFTLRDASSIAAQREERAEGKLNEDNAPVDGETNITTKDPRKVAEAART